MDQTHNKRSEMEVFSHLILPRAGFKPSYKTMKPRNLTSLTRNLNLFTLNFIFCSPARDQKFIDKKCLLTYSRNAAHMLSLITGVRVKVFALISSAIRPLRKVPYALQD